MQLSIPIYFETRRGGESSRQRHILRPLFFQTPMRTDESLGRALSKLAQELTAELNRLGREANHEELSKYVFAPEVTPQKLKLRLELRRQVVRGQFFCVTFRAFARRVGFFPGVPDVWFEFRRGQTLEHRATEVLTAHFRKLEKDEGTDFEFPEHALLDGNAWIAPLEIDVSTTQRLEPPQKDIFAILGSAERVDGGAELQRVGRCLNWLYPSELDRVVDREAEVSELQRLLSSDDKRPVLLVGPRLVGKTAIIHEHTYRDTAKRNKPYASRHNVWLLSPQRLVSGMSYVGQWENRLLAILKKAEKKDHVLYFDDFLGLYHAGISCDSTLSMAQVLRPYVERRACRFLAEMTPEALRVFRERDRGLADQFHILPVAEPSDDANLRIQFSVIRQLEAQRTTRFGLDALPTVLDLARRYLRDGVFPGKAARFLQQLAVQFPLVEIARPQVLAEFRSRSGLALEFVDRQQKLDRETVLAALRRKMIGQSEALEAAADVLCIAKARLNDPGRPLASLLFLGPTGVGKTQCAKALAAYLFGDESRLVRFDMNEFVAPGSGARLVGTFDQPEGVLTSAIRRQPFAVLLLDEIEKASPEVLDLLLQVLGEGRLTDALGRTVDFTNTIVVLTSNLGVREAAGRVGFGDDDTPDRQVYVKAAERFFRPEMFNRLDRIVPFSALGRGEIRQIARLVIQDVLSREGLSRRKCYLRIDEPTLDQVAEAGFSPKYGARALKRAIERQLTQPVATKLAGLRPDAITVLNLYAGPNGLAADLQSLHDADPSPRSLVLLDLRDQDAVYERLRAAIARIESETASWRPSGSFSTHELGPQHYRYFLVRELLDQIHRDQQRWEERRGRQRPGGRYVAALPTAIPRGTKGWQDDGRKGVLRELGAVHDMHDFINELRSSGEKTDDARDPLLVQLLRQAALLQAVVASADDGAEQALLYIRTPDPSGEQARKNLHTMYRATFGEALSLESLDVPQATFPDVSLLVVKGPHARALAEADAGTHLSFPRHEHFIPIQVGTLDLPDGTDPVKRYTDFHRRRTGWLHSLAVGTGRIADDPAPWQPVVRIYESPGPTLDIRTGRITSTSFTPPDLKDLLPLPIELTESPSEPPSAP